MCLLCESSWILFSSAPEGEEALGGEKDMTACTKENGSHDPVLGSFRTSSIFSPALTTRRVRGGRDKWQGDLGTIAPPEFAIGGKFDKGGDEEVVLFHDLPRYKELDG